MRNHEIVAKSTTSKTSTNNEFEVVVSTTAAVNGVGMKVSTTRPVRLWKLSCISV